MRFRRLLNFLSFLSLPPRPNFRQSRDAIKDYSVYCLKLKVASRNFWESPAPKSFPSSLLAVARSIFNQVFCFL